ncbi:olfactory receptor 2B6-like [Lissotriton helveticus]
MERISESVRLSTWERLDYSASMDGTNLTLGSGFFFLSFSDISPQLQHLLSVAFILIYLITLLGNLIIFLIITLEPALHTPMYFFLRHLSLVDICYINTSVPKTISGLVSKDKHISFSGCVSQMFCFTLCGITDSILLTVMSLDRYVAICIPLRYTIIMRSSMCRQLALGSWIIGFTSSLIMTPLTFSLPFCKSHEILHFLCDVPSVMNLACGDTFITECISTVISALVLIVPLMLIVTTYTFIISKILKIQSTVGRQTAASTCVSHMIAPHMERATYEEKEKHFSSYHLLKTRGHMYKKLAKRSVRKIGLLRSTNPSQWGPNNVFDGLFPVQIPDMHDHFE